MASDGIVYVIDDDEAARHSLEFLLDCASIRVRAFHSADAFLAARPPLGTSCIVTDVRMPGRSGIELVEEMKHRGAHVPVTYSVRRGRSSRRGDAHASGKALVRHPPCRHQSRPEDRSMR